MSVFGRLCLAGFGDLDRLSPGDDFLVGANADEGVAAYAFATFDGLEHEALGFAFGEAQEGGDGGFQIGGETAVDGDEGVCGGESFEGFAEWQAGRLRMLWNGHIEVMVHERKSGLVGSLLHNR